MMLRLNVDLVIYGMYCLLKTPIDVARSSIHTLGRHEYFS